MIRWKVCYLIKNKDSLKIKFAGFNVETLETTRKVIESNGITIISFEWTETAIYFVELHQSISASFLKDRLKIVLFERNWIRKLFNSEPRSILD